MSNDTLVADPSPDPVGPSSARRSTGDKVRFVLRGIGQTLITLGLVVLLFVVYEVWVTNLFSRAENDDIAKKTEQVWARGEDPTLPSGGASTIPLGTGIAAIYIPRLGRDYHWFIVEGTGQDDLEKGPGHYPNSQLPGQKGNFAVAGHRVGKGEPFLNLDKLRAGDPIIIATKSSWFVYRVLGSPAGSDPQDNEASVKIPGGTDKVPGREIVDPSAGRVLYPVPNDKSVSKGEAIEKLITLTTCHPKFTAAKRMIIHGRLDTTTPVPVVNGKRDTKMPAEIDKLYSQGGI